MTTKHADTAARGAVDASMTLLTQVYRRPLDPGYQQAADRRAEHPAEHRSPRSVVLLVVLAIVLGLGATAATIALRPRAGAAQESRRVLEEQITARAAAAAATEQEVAELGAQIAALQADLLGASDAASGAGLSAGVVEAAMLPVTGSGLRIVLSDAPTDDPDTQDPDARVQDVDLQVVVNGLWAAGAEAVAVNGQRLGSTTAIRSAGSAVLVDLTPLSSPYTVDVVGDAASIQTQLSTALAGRHLATLRATYGIGVQIASRAGLELPGTGPVTLRSATVPPDAAPAPQPSGSTPDDSASGADVAGSAGRGTGEL